MHVKDLLWLITRVGYRIPVTDFYLVLHVLRCQKSTLKDQSMIKLIEYGINFGENLHNEIYCCLKKKGIRRHQKTFTSCVCLAPGTRIERGRGWNCRHRRRGKHRCPWRATRPPHGSSWLVSFNTTVEPLLRGHPDERPLPLERPLDIVNLNINVSISIPDERPPLLKGHFSDAKGVALQEGFHCIYYTILY